MTEFAFENHKKQLQESQKYWDDQAPRFDNQPDHGLRDPIVRQAWTEFLKAWLPPVGSTVLDIGCGTGSLSVVIASLGHTITGIDLSPSMIALARAKAASQGFQADFQIMDAAYPEFPGRSFDVIVCRHLLWALPKPEQVLQRWSEILTPGGRLILIEGYWSTGAGFHSDDLSKMLPPNLRIRKVIALSENSKYWGGKVADERYAVIAEVVS